MGASAYVGRVGGLAVARGIGAAVFLGHGVASAETPHEATGSPATKTGNQVTPIPVTLNGRTQTITAPLNMVSATLQRGQTVTLQLVASAADFATIWSLGALTVSSMTLSVPTANPSAVTAIV